ncbi:MAG TPA: CvpA family protein [Acetobacteraceae bacterium]|nr:CvpA family protein [Acetobacteraceae bacterium]
MNWVDLLVLALLAFSALLGLMRGLVREVLGIGAWVGAILAGVLGFHLAQPFFRRMIANPDIADPVAFGAIFLVTLIILSIVARTIGMAVRRSALGGLDRTLGLVFGFARGAVLLVAAYILGGMVLSVESWPPPVLHARTLPAIYQGARWTTRQLPAQYRPHVSAPPGPDRLSAEALLHATPSGRSLDPAR